MIIALAGRRIDAPHTGQARFPLENVEKLKKRLKDFFLFHKVSVLVCSAACGSDLLALDIAGELNLYRKIILPFPPEIFKMKSVNDCRGNWEPLFDRICNKLNQSENLLVLPYEEDDQNAYKKTNLEILNAAEKLVQSSRNETKKIIALAVWDGKSKEHDDTTAHFLEEARSRNMDIEEINTLS